MLSCVGALRASPSRFLLFREPHRFSQFGARFWRHLQEPQQYFVEALVVIGFLIAHNEDDSMPRKGWKQAPIIGAMAVTEATDTVAFKVTVYGKPPDEHKIYQIIGRVASEWSHLDHMLDLIISELTGLDDHTAACLTGQVLTTRAKYEAIIALLTRRTLSTGLIERAKKERSKSANLGKKRNRIVHDAWYLAVGDLATEQPKQFKTMAPDELTFGLHEPSDTEVQNTITEIRHRYDRTLELRALILAELRASRDKSS